jgi:3-mercaptopyruvate sulfurtransferase SseA
MALYGHGYDNVSMYDGSWNKWHQDEANPRDDVEALMARSPKQSQRG